MRSRRRRIVLRVLGGLLALVLVALVGGYLYAKPLLLTGTGYAAHNDCAVRAIAGRSDPRADLPPNPLVPYLRSSQAADNSSYSATVLGVLAGQTAYYGDAGCTLGTPLTGTGPLTQVPVGANPFDAVAVPAPSSAVAAAVAKAFGDDLTPFEQDLLGTRAVVVVQGGKLVAERYAPGFTAATPQLGWSMAKSAASLLTGRVVKEGKVAVTDAGLRPEWTDDRSKITVDQLMRMTSGLTWNEDYDLGTAITAMLYLEPDMAKFVASQPLAHAPGTYQQYSSGSTNLLCSVLRQRTGLGVDLPRRELFAPLGLSSAVWEPDGSGLPVCSSYLWATPRDWAALGQFALQDGVWGGQRLLPEGWMAATTRSDAVATTEDPGYAAGWWANRLADGTLDQPTLPADTYRANGHDGQRIYVVPSADLVVVRLGFSPSIKTPEQLRVVDLVATLAGMPRA
ncbi:MAG TPA: serine hydrolase [Dermatophilaceae bacterium]|jgi:CubicO group peptidase (beta-lactamase class C family)|uniref:Serine hydrolase n=1 Tax=Candidatus Phosphoribacter hodrii TaxID=2953743 RepID=A0A9D7T683_9MICO|nr:serine hydrolase [Candidatus Phosphoribacter hodrii]OPZ55754.1 MAG: 6-aminohexanoate-dimer hydrolase [bacterium ADurb.BinA028]HNV14498.1 serine hydrolase [Dermatophilaceae bacterium]HOA01706.1 serine hydrolase [Dermatophilaceae bacterium]HOA57403.1 serine hydrolase [Dermatophilaceae bacterium]